MKTAEDFRQSIGPADEDFARCIQQTLWKLQREEEQPVKKKISLGLALAMAVMLLTVTAFAASQWGVLDFIKGQGKTPAEEKLVTSIVQTCEESERITVTVDEALIDGQTAYLAMTVQPKTEKTLIVPWTKDLSIAGGMAVMSSQEQVKDMSFREYADSKGFEQVISFFPPFGGSLGDVRNAVYESLENGGLRCILEYAYESKGAFPERTEWCIWTVGTIAFNGENTVPDEERNARWENLFLQAEIPVNICISSRRSAQSDAHDIAGYVGGIEYVTMTPMEDSSVQFTMMVDMNDADETEMYMWTATLLDENGQACCWLNGSQYNMGASNKTLLESTIPADCAGIALADKVTIQVHRVGGTETIYDTYTYTME